MDVHTRPSNIFKERVVTIYPRPSLLTYIGLILFSFGGYILIIDGMRQGHGGSVIIFLLGCILAVSNSWRRIWWTENMLIYRNLVTTRRIKFSDVDRFDMKFTNSSVEGDEKSLLGLYIWNKKSIKPEMIINIKLFPIPDLERLVARLREATEFNES
jgi:hypothetical protein